MGLSGGGAAVVTSGDTVDSFCLNSSRFNKNKFDGGITGDICTIIIFNVRFSSFGTIATPSACIDKPIWPNNPIIYDPHTVFYGTYLDNKGYPYMLASTSETLYATASLEACYGLIASNGVEVIVADVLLPKDTWSFRVRMYLPWLVSDNIPFLNTREIVYSEDDNQGRWSILTFDKSKQLLTIECNLQHPIYSDGYQDLYGETVIPSNNSIQTNILRLGQVEKS